ncbi:MAG TPA: adenosine kinase [Caulobacteraceae bacterium]|nr:adenosine kinase [Caulobacteraceae bacterium]
MNPLIDVTAIGNAIVDVIAPAQPGFIAAEGLTPGSMTLIDEVQASALYGRMAPGLEASGGSAANTVAGLASLGAAAAFIGKVADDELGAIFAHDIRAIGARFETPALGGGPATARCLVNVTPDAQRTMCTYLGACVRLTPDDVDPALIEGASIVYLEGYLFDPEGGRAAFAKAAALARASGRRIALTLSDGFVVERHRQALLGFIESQVDVVFANAEEAAALFPGLSPAEGRARLGSLVEIAAITDGPAGSHVMTAGQAIDVPAEPVAQVVDTTGAGDQYAAGFLFGLARGRPLAECGRLGSLAAAEVISHYGPRPERSLADAARQKGLLAA